MCSEKKLCNNNCDYCFNRSFASHEKAIYWSDKNELSPRKVFKKSMKYYWFDCKECGHEFYHRIQHIINGTWCRYCANRILCKDLDCKTCYEKSFASHEKANCWSNKNELSTRQVFKTSRNKYWLNCNICNHDFKTTPKYNNFCPYCSNTKLCENSNCKICYKKSFASYEKSNYWSNKNELLPIQVFKISGKKYWFDCNVCNHEFKSPLCVISSGIWCPYCSNKNLCENSNCKICYKKSFASYEKSNYWSNKNKLLPRQVFKYSNKKYWFDCKSCNNNFKDSLNHISYGRWCPFCKNKTELKCYDFLCDKFKVIRQYKLPSTNLPFDFLIEDKYILEIDGPQHFKQISNWDSFENVRKRDILKMKMGIKKGLKIIRIQQEVIFYDYSNWKKIIIDIIEKNNEKDIYLCSKYKNLYDKHIKEFQNLNIELY